MGHFMTTLKMARMSGKRSGFDVASVVMKKFVHVSGADMTFNEAIKILELYQNWNTGQKGFNTEEEEILIERRQTIKEAYRVLRSPEKPGPPK